MNSTPQGSSPPGGRQGPIQFPEIKDPLGLVGASIAGGGIPHILGPTRKIPVKRASLSGHVPFQHMQRNIWFESALERDLLLLLKPFDGFIGVLEQPVHLNSKRLGYKKGRYRPDFLIWIRKPGANTPKPVLIEVKYEEELRAKWPVIRRKLMTGRRFARRQGWRFLLFTPRHIRIPRPLPLLVSGERHKPYDLQDPMVVLARLFGTAFSRRLL